MLNCCDRCRGKRASVFRMKKLKLGTVQMTVSFPSCGGWIITRFLLRWMITKTQGNFTFVHGKYRLRSFHERRMFACLQNKRKSAVKFLIFFLTRYLCLRRVISVFFLFRKFVITISGIDNKNCFIAFLSRINFRLHMAEEIIWYNFIMRFWKRAS